jgi:sec-independent protein translocase protein TatC
MAHARHHVTPDDQEEELANGRMSFLEHLDELRTRLIRSCIAVALGMLVALIFFQRLAEFVLAPVIGALPKDTSLITTRPGEGLSFYLDLALIGGVVLAAPFVSYQAWRFIAPGLYARERRLVVPFAVLATIGTLGGALFSHYILFPSMMAFFATFELPGIRFTPRLQETFQLYRNMLIGMVAVFQIPTLVFVLARMRLVTATFLWRHIKYAILLSVIVAAILTPSPDPWNQLIFAAPIVGLYVVGIGVAWVVAPRSTQQHNSRNLKLVFAATIIDQAARRQRHKSSCAFPRLWRRTL